MLLEWIYVILLITALVVSTLLIGVSWSRRGTPTTFYFMIYLISNTVVITAYLFFSISADNDVAHLWVRVRLTALSLSPVPLFAFVVVYTGRGHLVKSPLRYAFLIVPAITAYALWVAPDWIWQSWEINRIHLINRESTEFAGWFYVHLVHSFSLIILSCALLIRYALTTTRVSRQQARTIAFGMITAISVGMLPTVGLTNGLPNPLPIGVLILVMTVFWALFRQGLLTRSPLAFQTIIENMHDAVIVLDMDDCLVYLNAPAKAKLNCDGGCIGKPLDALLGDHAHHFLADHLQARFEVVMDIGDTSYTFDVTRSPLLNHAGNLAYRLFVLHDITKRKHMEESLRTSERRFMSIAQSAPGMVYQFKIDADGGWHFPFVSQGVLDVYGHTPEQVARDAQVIVNTVHPDDLDSLETRIVETMAALSLFKITHRIIHADGDIRWIQARSMPERTPDGGILWTGIALDITEIKQMENALRESEESFRALVENSQDFIVRLSKEGKHLYVNSAFAAFMGRPAEEIIGKTNAELGVPEETNTKFTALREHIFTTGKAQEIESAYTASDGTLHYYHLRLVPEFDEHGQVVSILSSTRDITERKAMEDALRRSEELYRLLTENSTDSISLHHPDGRFIYTNATRKRLTGYTAEELMRFSADELRGLIHPDDFEDIGYSAHNQLSEGKQVSKLQYRVRHRDGHYIWAENHSVPIVDGDGNVIQILSTTRDITERRQAQQRRLELELEKERVNLLTRFIQDVSHEFRTPLSTIRTGTYLIARTIDDERRQQKLHQIDTQVDRITRLVDSLLMMVELESGSTLNRAEVDINALLDIVCQKLHVIYGAKPVLHREGQTVLPALTGDEDYLTDAFVQVLENAYRFTPPEGTITLRTDILDDTLFIEVRDTGVGIAQDVLPYVFETFWRDDEAHTTPGFGLGLPIAQKIIEQHNGQIMIDSDVGQGTQVRVHLPLTSAYSSVTATDSPSA